MSAAQEYYCDICGYEWEVDSLNGVEYSGCPKCKELNNNYENS